MAINPSRQNSSSSKGKSKKSSAAGLGTWIVVLLVIFLRSFSKNVSSSDFAYYQRQLQMAIRRIEVRLGLGQLAYRLRLQLGFDPLPWIALILVIVVIAALVKAVRRGKKAAEDAVPSASRSAGRVSAATRRPDPRTKSFTNPDPYCIVCDQNGDDHFRHDKAQRIKQLDEWLKNGLIDREEYRVMKNRYEHDL